MESNEIFKFIQKSIENVPLILVGSGSSAPHGLPGMVELGRHLMDTLTPQYNGDINWDKFKTNIEAGQDLETALTGITLTNQILDDIKIETWKLISSRDIGLFIKVVFGGEQLPLARLIKKLYQVHPQCLNIITTNYDRVIEYACDSAQLPVNTGFDGNYLKKFKGDFCTRNAINLIKVHGSLDVFKDSHDATFSIPIQHELPCGLIPEIITPGLSKYQAVLRGTSRQLLTESDSLIRKAQSYLCIGYGFNDEQIQENIVTSIRTGKPIVVVTKNVSEHAAHLLANNAQNYVSIECGEKEETSNFCINRNIFTLEGTYWTIDGLMKIID